MVDQTTTQKPLTIYVVQDPPPSLLKIIKDALDAEEQGAAYPRNRNTFWFEQAWKHLAKSDTNYELVIPYQLPKDATDQHVPQILQDIGKQHRIHWVPIPHEAVEGHVRMDNDGWKAGFHGLEYGAPFSKKDFQSSQEFSRLMAQAVADRTEAGHRATGDIVGVNIQNRYMCLVPGYLNEEMQQRGQRDTYVATYFSHIDQTHKINVFVKTPEIKPVVASLLETNIVNFHTPKYAANFMRAAEKLFPHKIKADYKKMTISHALGGAERTVKVGSHFLGIDVERWQRLVTEPAAWDHAKEFLEQAKGRKILFAYDRCDPIKALDDRVAIFGKFLDRNPDLADKVVLMQAYYLANDTPREYADVYSSLYKRTNEWADTVNANFSTTHGASAPAPIIKLPKIDEMKIAGLIIAASVSGGTHIVSSVAEGLHMGMLESFAANAKLSLVNPELFKELAQKHDVPLNKNSGPLSFWTSEVAGVVHYVKETIIPMNPSKHDASVRALRQAVAMPPAERVTRIAKSWPTVRDRTSAEWVDAMQQEINNLRDHQRAPAVPTRLTKPRQAPGPIAASVRAYS